MESSVFRAVIFGNYQRISATRQRGLKAAPGSVSHLLTPPPAKNCAIQIKTPHDRKRDFLGLGEEEGGGGSGGGGAGGGQSSGEDQIKRSTFLVSGGDPQMRRDCTLNQTGSSILRPVICQQRTPPLIRSHSIFLGVFHVGFLLMLSSVLDPEVPYTQISVQQHGWCWMALKIQSGFYSMSFEKRLSNQFSLEYFWGDFVI